MQKKVILNSVVLNTDGSAFIVFSKQIIDDNGLAIPELSQNHRLTIPPGSTATDVVNLITGGKANLVANGWVLPDATAFDATAAKGLITLIKNNM